MSSKISILIYLSSISTRISVDVKFIIGILFLTIFLEWTKWTSRGLTKKRKKEKRIFKILARYENRVLKITFRNACETLCWTQSYWRLYPCLFVCEAILVLEIIHFVWNLKFGTNIYVLCEISSRVFFFFLHIVQIARAQRYTKISHGGKFFLKSILICA